MPDVPPTLTNRREVQAWASARQGAPALFRERLYRSCSLHRRQESEVLQALFARSQRHEVEMIPTRREDLLAMGYVFDNEATCRGCFSPIEWWITPNGKKMPMSVVEVKDEK